MARSSLARRKRPARGTVKGHATFAVFSLLLAAAAACRAPEPMLPDAGARERRAALDILMADELRAAERAGAGQPVLGLMGSGIPGDDLGGLVDIPRAGCALILGRGGPGVQDVDVFAFAEDGTVMASDESPAKPAGLFVCPGKSVRVFASGRLAAGFGLFAMTAHIVPPERTESLARELGITRESAAQPRDMDVSWPGLEERLAEHHRHLGGEWESVRKVSVPLDPRVYTHVPARVEGPGCIDVLLTPSDDVAHVELEALEAGGRWIGSGRALGAERNLTLCSAETREIVLRCRPHAGRGLAALVLSRSPGGTSRDLHPGLSRFDLRAQQPVDDARAELARRLEASGYPAPSSTKRGRLELERRTSVPLSLAKGCSRIDVLTAAPVSSIAAWLWDDEGRLLAEDGRGIGATLFACGAGGDARLDLETLASGGEYLVELRHAAQLPAAARAERLATSRLLSLLDARGLLSSFTRLPELGIARVSDTSLTRFQLELEAGRCMELSAAIGSGASGLEVRLFEPAASSDAGASDDAAIGYGPRAATARVCAIEPARHRLLTAELRANVGRGTVIWTSHEIDPASSAANSVPLRVRSRRR